MCRLFGFRSNSPSSVHRSLVYAKNSLRQQSIEHKDGWGIAYYVHAGERPEVAHGLGPAHQDPDFERVSNLVSSQTVLAHVRLASVGPVHIHNAHPFVHGRWAFAHNGTVREFQKYRPDIESEIDKDLLTLIKGETDSERCFYLFLTYLRRWVPAGQNVTAEDVARALAQTAQLASYVTRNTQDLKPTSVNLIATDGRVMAVTRRHRTLFFSEGHSRQTGPHEVPRNGTQLRKIVIASEELSGEDHWHEVPEEGVVGIEADMTLRCWTLQDLAPSKGH